MHWLYLCRRPDNSKLYIEGSLANGKYIANSNGIWNIDNVIGYLYPNSFVKIKV